MISGWYTDGSAVLGDQCGSITNDGLSRVGVGVEIVVEVSKVGTGVEFDVEVGVGIGVGIGGEVDVEFVV